MELVWIAYRVPHVRDGQGGHLQQLPGLGHAVGDEELLGRFPHCVVEDLSEVAPVQVAEGGDVLHRDVVLEVLLNKCHGLPDVEVPHPVPLALEGGGVGLVQVVQEQIQVSDQVEGGLLGVVGDVDHLLHHLPGQILVPGPVYGRVDGEAGGLDQLLGLQAVELQPGVFPGQLIVRYVGADLVGEDHKALAALDVVGDRLLFGVVGCQRPGPGDHVVEQVVVPGGGTEGVSRVALLPAVLVQAQINEIFTRKNRIQNIAHDSTSRVLNIIYQNAR